MEIHPARYPADSFFADRPSAEESKFMESMMGHLQQDIEAKGAKYAFNFAKGLPEAEGEFRWTRLASSAPCKQYCPAKRERIDINRESTAASSL